MKRLLISTSLAAATMLPSVAQAQAVPTATVAVVDLDRVQSQCTACKTAAATLRSQATAEENREKTVAGPLQTEQQSIQAAVDAQKGNPDAALQTRIKTFQTRAQAAQEEIARGRQQLQRNQAYIGQQIQAKLNPIYTQVMQRRGANILVEQGTTLAAASALDVTNDVIAALNSALPTIQTTAPAAPATPANQTQGR
jgi:Skp family chaperone for outer membrane proteins